MSKITFAEIILVFDDLLSNKITREEADRWAYKLMQEFDNDNLNFVPDSDEDKIWEALNFLYGIDLKDTPTRYFHSDEDIKDYISRYIKNN